MSNHKSLDRNIKKLLDWYDQNRNFYSKKFIGIPYKFETELISCDNEKIKYGDKLMIKITAYHNGMFATAYISTEFMDDEMVDIKSYVTDKFHNKFESLNESS